MDRESPDLVRQAPEAVQMGISGDGGTRSISERRNEVAERTGVEISSTVLGQDKKFGQVPFYTGIIPT